MKDPAFLFYPNDYIGGTMGMTFEQKGAYIELLMTQFNRGHMDTHMVRHMLGEKYDELWSILKGKFEIDSEGRYFNKRLEDEQKRRKDYSASRMSNLDGKNKYQKKPSHMESHMTSHMETETINENITINERKKKAKIETEIYPSVVYPFETDTFIATWKVWKEYKAKQHKFSFKTTMTEQAALKHLGELSGQDELTALLIIQQSIANGWKGFFPLKDNQYGQQTGDNRRSGNRISQADRTRIAQDILSSLNQGTDQKAE